MQKIVKVVSFKKVLLGSTAAIIALYFSRRVDSQCVWPGN